MREKYFEIPDLIKMEQFLVYLQQLDRNIVLINEQKKLMEKLLFEYNKELKASRELISIKGKNENEINRISNKWNPKIAAITQEKKIIESNIKSLFNILVQFKINFNYEESMQQDEN